MRKTQPNFLEKNGIQPWQAGVLGLAVLVLVGIVVSSLVNVVQESNKTVTDAKPENPYPEGTEEHVMFEEK